MKKVVLSQTTQDYDTFEDEVQIVAGFSQVEVVLEMQSRCIRINGEVIDDPTFSLDNRVWFSHEDMEKLIEEYQKWKKETA